MCGIAGFYSTENSFSKEDLVKMTNALAHRGPDAAGYYFTESPHIGLGHRRLSILDLSESANQPFYSSCGNYVIVFNGEIYNYRELYPLLRKPLKTTGDTEVIIELFIQEGPAFVERLNGMFAFVILDIVQQKLYLFRDRLGVKPLFMANVPSGIAFSSEIKSFVQCPAVCKGLALNRRAVSKFLHLGYIPEPETIYASVSKFPAGSYAVFDGNVISYTTYWDIASVGTRRYAGTYEEAKKTVHELLVSSVMYRTISDVPIGTFLSGGIDSSIVTAIAQRNSSHPINTFSIGFESSSFNESGYAKKIAGYLGTNHHEYTVTQTDAINNLQQVMSNFDEPFTDTSALPVYLVSSLARQSVKVVLTGDGGDEGFLGYGAYQWANRLNQPLLKAFRKPLGVSMKLLGNDRIKRASELFLYPSVNKQSHIFSQEQYLFSEKELSRLICSGYQYRTEFTRMDWSALSPAENQALFDLKYYLKDDLLVKVDRASMLCSIEARDPLLDYRLLELAFSLPETFKLQGTTSKKIVKEILFQYVPKEFFERPKWGFAIPLHDWLQGRLSFLISEYLSEESIRRVGLLDPQVVSLYRKQYQAGAHYLYNRIWAMIVLQKWAIEHLSSVHSSSQD
ncbi:MAG: asparagine synthase (glutamine-hydrolyzing) [Cytophagaceae bacterium]|jgi:asparagine synthase (glutamine-hydrolysing)|nr:asparagine synthase (glutamine-hydrolyzing) [Cytophagaceae bacterium]